VTVEKFSQQSADINVSLFWFHSQRFIISFTKTYQHDPHAHQSTAAIQQKNLFKL